MLNKLHSWLKFLALLFVVMSGLGSRTDLDNQSNFHYITNFFSGPNNAHADTPVNCTHSGASSNSSSSGDCVSANCIGGSAFCDAALSQGSAYSGNPGDAGASGFPSPPGGASGSSTGGACTGGSSLY